MLAAVSGTLQAWRVMEGSAVQQGDVLAVMEAMKMEMQLAAPCSGRITQLVPVGAYYEAGAVLARIGAS